MVMKNFNLRKKLCLLLSLVILIISVSTVFATNIQDGDWIFEIPTTGEDVYYVSSYTGTSDTIRIPALCLSKPVVKINNATFLNRTDLTYVEIPATIKVIGQNAFYGCSSITGITIPSFVEEIGPNAFYGCSGLRTLNFNNNNELTKIAQNTFSGCSSLSTVTLPDNLTSIGRNAFFDCTSLSAVTIGPYVTDIDATAFKNCTRLTIFCWNDTYAQEFAAANNIPFISLGDYDYPQEPTETQPDTDPTTPDELPTEPSTPNTEPTESDPSEPTKYPQGKIYLIGDADLSGRINVKDATLIQKYAADLVRLDRTQLFLANCNSEGGVNVKDATLIQKYCAGYSNILFVGDEVEL